MTDDELRAIIQQVLAGAGPLRSDSTLAPEQRINTHPTSATLRQMRAVNPNSLEAIAGNYADPDVSFAGQDAAMDALNTMYRTGQRGAIDDILQNRTINYANRAVRGN